MMPILPTTALLLSLFLNASVMQAQEPEVELVAQALAGGPGSDVAVISLRAQGQAGLDLVSTAYAQQRVTADPFEDNARWDGVFDAVGGQLGNRVSRLYWYTDLGKAIMAAQLYHRPILALRLLGKLTDPLSCANSRFFRTILYPDPHLSAWLRDHVILYWSSERPAPQVSIDFGDGRVLHTTLGGNSVHVILDSDGKPIDALPGLYGSTPFLDHLQAASNLVKKISGMPQAERTRMIAEYHQHERDAETLVLRSYGIKPTRQLDDVDDWSIEAAERLTVSKCAVEMPLLMGIGLVPLSPSRERSPYIAGMLDRLAARMSDLGVLSDVSCGIVIAQMTGRQWQGHDANSADMAVIAKVQSNVAKDTIIDEYLLHPAIHRFLLAHAGCTIDDLQRWIYARLFQTPASDPWLGMQPPAWDGISHREVVDLQLSR